MPSLSAEAREAACAWRRRVPKRSACRNRAPPEFRKALRLGTSALPRALRSPAKHRAWQVARLPSTGSGHESHETTGECRGHVFFLAGRLRNVAHKVGCLRDPGLEKSLYRTFAEVDRFTGVAENRFMRLTAEQVRSIRDPILEEDPGAEILLFGSRADDHARGGDIDILCFSQKIDRRSKRRIRREISDRVGGQKVDLVVAKDASTPFVRLVMEEAVPLTPRIPARNESSIASPSS